MVTLPQPKSLLQTRVQRSKVTEKAVQSKSAQFQSDQLRSRTVHLAASNLAKQSTTQLLMELESALVPALRKFPVRHKQ